jgi:hypothetical protein
VLFNLPRCRPSHPTLMSAVRLSVLDSYTSTYCRNVALAEREVSAIEINETEVAVSVGEGGTLSVARMNAALYSVKGALFHRSSAW